MREQSRRRAATLLRSLILLVFCAHLFAATAVVEVIADAGLVSGSGTDKQLPLTGVVMRFRVEAIRGWKVAKAELHLHSDGSAPADVEIAVTAAPWREDQATKLDVKKLRFLRKKTDTLPDGWWRVEVEPSLVEMLASGTATELVIRGRTSAAAKHSVDSREKNFSAGYLLVEGQPN